MSSFKVYPSPTLPELKISYTKVVRPILFADLPGFKVSDVINSYVSYNFDFQTTTNRMEVELYLELSEDNVHWTIINQSSILTPSAPPVDIKIGNLTGFIPKGNYVRIRGQVDANSSVTYLDGIEYSFSF